MTTKAVPKFEGKEVRGRELKLTGAVRIDAALGAPQQIGDEIVVIGTFKVDHIDHADKPKRGIVRLEGASAIDFYVVSGDLNALDLLQRVQREREEQMDALLGRARLPLDQSPDVSEAKRSGFDDDIERLRESLRDDEGGTDPEAPPGA